MAQAAAHFFALMRPDFSSFSFASAGHRFLSYNLYV
jgi:hypothetical protein